MSSKEILYTTEYIDSILATSCADDLIDDIKGVFTVRILKDEKEEDYVEVLGGPYDGKRFLIFKCQLTQKSKKAE